MKVFFRASGYAPALDDAPRREWTRSRASRADAPRSEARRRDPTRRAVLARAPRRSVPDAAPLGDLPAARRRGCAHDRHAAARAVARPLSDARGDARGARRAAA